MKTFPMFLTLAGRRVVIVGAGEQAAQKCRLMLKTEAAIELVAESPQDELAALIDAGRITRIAPAIGMAAFRGAALVFLATGCKGADMAWHALAQEAGALTNVVDAPDLCDAFTPSIVDRDPVVIAIGTEGTAPVLGRQLKTRIEQMLEPGLGDLAALTGRLRPLAARFVPMANRRPFWRWVFGGLPRQIHASGSTSEAARLIKQAIREGGAPERTPAMISLIGAPPDSRDHLTLRAVQRLQEADVIYHDPLDDPLTLELARRDAERVRLGDDPGAAPDALRARLIEDAAQGRRVVCLRRAGDLAHEAQALCDAGAAAEVIPGVSAIA